MSGEYLTALVCLNGHIISDAIEHTATKDKFCGKCGAQTFDNCPACRTRVRGRYHVPGALTAPSYNPPSYCFRCGAPFPWTEVKLTAARDLADEMDELTEEDRAKLKSAIADITSDGAQAQVGATRIKKMVGKAKTAIGQAVWKITVEIASEAAKKILLGS